MLLCFVGLLDTLLTCSRSWWEFLGNICWQHKLRPRQRIDKTNSDPTHQGLLDQEQCFADTQDLWSFFADLCSELSWTTYPSTRPDMTGPLLAHAFNPCIWPMLGIVLSFSAYLSNQVSLITNFKEHLRDEIGVAVSEVQHAKRKRRMCGTPRKEKPAGESNRILLVWSIYIVWYVW